MSKQLSFSAAISTIVMAAFALLAATGAPVTHQTGATSVPAAPAFEITLPVR